MPENTSMQRLWTVRLMTGNITLTHSKGQSKSQDQWPFNKLYLLIGKLKNHIAQELVPREANDFGYFCKILP